MARTSYFYNLIVIGMIVLLAFLESNVSFFARGLIAAPYLLLVVIVALFGDYLMGVITVVFSAAALAYIIPPLGFQLTSTGWIKLTEFLIAAIIACALAWRVRNLRSRNMGLSEKVNNLNSLIGEMERELKDDKHALSRLRKLNSQLDELVAQFIDDDSYWQNRLVVDVSKAREKRKKW